MSKFGILVIALLNVVVCISICVHKLYDSMFHKKVKVTKMNNKGVYLLSTKVKETVSSISNNGNLKKTGEVDSIIEVEISSCQDYESDSLFKVIVVE